MTIFKIYLDANFLFSFAIIFFRSPHSALDHVHGLKLRITSRLNDGFQSEIPQTMFVSASIHSLNYGIQFEMPQEGHVPGLNCACQQLCVQLLDSLESTPRQTHPSCAPARQAAPISCLIPPPPPLLLYAQSSSVTQEEQTCRVAWSLWGGLETFRDLLFVPQLKSVTKFIPVKQILIWWPEPTMFAKFARNFKGKKKHSNEKFNMIVRMTKIRCLSTILDNKKNWTQTSSKIISHWA
jgi:hypothetical protein